MSFAGVGTIIQAQASTFTLTPHTVGNIVLLEVTALDTAVTPSSVSSSNVTWSALTNTFTGSTNAWCARIFIGTVTSTSAQTVTVTWAGGTPSTPQIAGQEFSTTVGAASVTLDVQGNIDRGTGNTWASLTPGQGAGELYFGYCVNGGSASNGSTTGYTYQQDSNHNGMAYNPSCGASATAPVWGDADEDFGIMVLVYEASAAAASSPPLPPIQPGRTWTRRFRQRQTYPYPITTTTIVPISLTDSGSGTDTLAPGIATAYPFPPAMPGQTWLRRFRHRQAPLYTSTFSIGLSTSGAGSDSLTVASSVPLADSGAGVDSLAISSSVPLADSGSGTDTLSAAIISPPLPLNPGRTWLRQFKHRQTFPYLSSITSKGLNDSGTGSDALTISTSISFTDSGSGADSLAIASSVLLSDSGAGVDTFGTAIINPPLPLSPGRTWIRQFKHRQTFPYLSGIGFVNVQLSDGGHGADALTISSAVPLTDSGTGTAALGISSSVPLSDSGHGADALSVSSTVPLSDSGTGTDVLQPGIVGAPAPTQPVQPGQTWRRQFKHRQTYPYLSPAAGLVSVQLSDSGSGSDALSIASSVPLSTSGSGTVSLAVTSLVQLADSGAGTASISAVVPVSLHDAGTGLDTLGVGVVNPAPLRLKPGRSWLHRYKHPMTFPYPGRVGSQPATIQITQQAINSVGFGQQAINAVSFSQQQINSIKMEQVSLCLAI